MRLNIKHFAIVSFLSLVFGYNNAECGSYHTKVIKQKEYETVQFKVQDIDTSHWASIGSGVLINDPATKAPAVATAAHVVEALGSYAAAKVCLFAKPEECTLVIDVKYDSQYQWDTDFGIAMIKSFPRGGRPTQIKSNELSLGEEVLLLGYPGGQPMAIWGRLVSKNRKQHGMMIIDGYGWFGTSGSPVFDTKGKWIGITSSLLIEEIDSEQIVHENILNVYEIHDYFVR